MSKVLIASIVFSAFSEVEGNEVAIPLEYSLPAGACVTGIALKNNDLFVHGAAVPCEDSQVCLGVEENPQFFNTENGGAPFQAHHDAPPQTHDCMCILDWNSPTQLYAYVYASVPLNTLTGGSVDLYALIED